MIEERDLERRLHDLASHLEWPPTPPLAASIRQRLAEGAGAAGPSTRRTWARRLGPAAAQRLAAAFAVVLLIAVVAAGIAPVRDTVAGWLGLRGVTIERAPTPPTAPPRAASPSASSPGAGLDLGTPQSLAAARSGVRFTVSVPSELAAPAAVFVRTPPAGGAVSLLYPPTLDLPDDGQTGAGLLVTEFRGDLDLDFIGKILGPGTTLTPVDVGGRSGYWIAGAPHQLFYRDSSGAVVDDSLRLTGNVLVFESGQVTIRLECSCTASVAVAVAASMR